MTLFLLMRHAEPDFSGPNRWKTPGWGADLAPLTDFGEQQVQQQTEKIREFNPQIVITSPATRAVHSALVLRPELQVPFKVEFDLHEWVPDRTFQWRSLADVEQLFSEFEQFKGEWPVGETLAWETVTSMRQRALSVLRKYLAYQRVLTICHGQLIRAITGIQGVALAGFVPLQLDE